MKLTHHTHLVRCVLALVALCAVGVQAGPVEDTAQAESLIRGGDFVSAMGLLRKAAEQNHAPAQARLADLLLTAEFQAEAMALYRKAAEQGEAAGEFGLGRIYADGLGVARDEAAAVDWYQKAKAKNHGPAVDALARAYRTGTLGMPKDIEKANQLDALAKVLLKSGDGGKR